MTVPMLAQVSFSGVPTNAILANQKLVQKILKDFEIFGRKTFWVF